MVFISEEMIRRRAEHNEGQLCSLEEVSLHQQDIERIQHIDRWCRELRILNLLNNLIPRIENLGRLKKLQYLNLGLNNIEVIENLEGCESLQKLDLTVNFVGRLSSVDSLRHNGLLTQLFLTGNPCTEFQGYRKYVVASLPGLKWLDGAEISRSERIQASQGLEEVRRRVWAQEEEHLKRRAREKEEEEGDEERKPGNTAPEQEEEEQEEEEEEETEEEEEEQEEQEETEEERRRRLWHTPSSFTPETRLKDYRLLQEERRAKEKAEEKTPAAVRTLIAADGRVLNVNEAKLGFCLTEDENSDSVVLELQVYRHMDTSLIDVDVQPTYARVCVKGKIFQVVLPAEVKPDSSTAQRSQTTGHLVLSMPRVQTGTRVCLSQAGSARGTRSARRPAGGGSSPEERRGRKSNVPERLEVDPSKHRTIDLAGIVPRRRTGEAPPPTPDPGSASEGTLDDPDVPPLI